MNIYLEKISGMYQEHSDSSFTSEGRHYLLNPLFRGTHNSTIINVPVDELKWVLAYCKPDPERVKLADMSAPILITRSKFGLTAVDGLHRLVKAVQSGAKTLPARFIPDDVLRSAEIPKTR